MCCYFKKRISYCRFVSAETERASITHTPCPNTGGIPPNKRLQEGKSGAWDWVSSCPSFLRHVFLPCQAWATRSLPYTAHKPVES